MIHDTSAAPESSLPISTPRCGTREMIRRVHASGQLRRRHTVVSPGYSHAHSRRTAVFARVAFLVVLLSTPAFANPSASLRGSLASVARMYRVARAQGLR